MNLSYRWLKDFVDIDVPAAELAQALFSLGLEVASISSRRVPRGIKVAHVQSVEKHPSADKLSVCQVDVGGSAPVTIVCGAPNVRPGMKAPLATIGTRLGDLEIKKAKLRGVESNGMLCSERELGLSDDHSGLMELPEDSPIGTEMSSLIPDDDILEIEITPDRGDCLSVLGIAREVAARFRLPRKDTIQRPIEGDEEIRSIIDVAIDAPAACPRYAGRYIRGVKVGPSPSWMQQRLVSAGLRPINNVVDVTNYVLLHCGQPMHAFDSRLIDGNRIVVRKASSGEKMKTLDGVERTLTAEDLLICDARKPVALAGIMGGEGSAISDTTTDVFLECAFFDPIGVRKTSKRLGLSTDSSYRFERGVDYDAGLIDALDLAAELIRQTAGGSVAKGRLDRYPAPLSQRRIRLRPAQVRRLLGIPVETSQIRDYIESLSIAYDGGDHQELFWIAPSYRHDLQIEADLIEEIGRLYGYDNIPSSTSAPVSLVRLPRREEERCDLIRRTLAASGLHEIMTNSMTSEKKRSLLTPDTRAISILNPLNPEMAQLRTTLLGNALETVAYNLNRKNLNNRLFEIGRVFEERGTTLAYERTMLAITLQGDFWPDSWNTPKMPSSFYVLKGIVENLARALGIEVLDAVESSLPAFLSDERCSIRLGEFITGFIGKIEGRILKDFDIGSNVYFAQLDITDLLSSDPRPAIYSPLPKFPALERDFCFVLPEGIAAQKISDAIFASSPLVEHVHPFDLYRGEKLGSGKKSIAFAVRLRSPERTLTDKEAADISEKIIKLVGESFSGTLR